MDQNSLLALQKYLSPDAQAQMQPSELAMLRRLLTMAAPHLANSPILDAMTATARRSNPQPQILPSYASAQ